MSDDKSEPSGLDVARAMIDGAQVVVLDPAAPRGAKKPGSKSKADAAQADAAPRAKQPPAPPPRSPRAPDIELPEDCPVLPLGVNGNTSYYLDELRQLRELKAREHSRLEIQHLFGRRNDLCERFWPRINADGMITGWAPEKAAKALMGAAAAEGVWDPLARVRGAGAWLGHGGELILNCGDKIWIGPSRAEILDAQAKAGKIDDYREQAKFLANALSGEWIEPGAHGRFVYPAAAALPKPRVDAKAMGKIYDATKPGEELLDLLKTWNWRRGEIDAHLLLGWIAAAILGGALKWRPMAWITGGYGTGKSTLQDLIQLIFGEGGTLNTNDATAAGIWQELGHRTIPVKVDELEADTDNSRALAVVKLARLAASGGTMMRGGQAHNSVSFTIRACFLFSSILIPPLLQQDRSRLAILQLNPLKKGAEPPAMPADATHALGSAIRQRLIDQWPRHEATLEIYRAALQAENFDARGQDQFGALLAAADLLLHTHEPTQDIAGALAMELAATQVAELAMRGEGQLAVLSPLLAYGVPGRHPGQILSISECIEAVLDGRADRARNAQLLGEAAPPGEDEAHAEKTLRRFGVLVIEGDEKPRPIQWIAIANQHPALTRIYANTKWNTPAGSDESVWKQALSSIPGHRASPKTLWFGLTSRAVLLPAQTVIRLEANDANDASPHGGGAAVAAST
jgi:hypothetical protein